MKILYMIKNLAQRNKVVHSADTLYVISKLEVSEQRVKELEASALVPGVLHCEKCQFQLTKTNVYTDSGTTWVGENKTEPCPNGCGPLWPVTWRSWAVTGFAEADKYFAQLKAAEQTADELVMQIRRLVHSLKNANPNSTLVAQVVDYMKRKGYFKLSDCLRSKEDQ